MTAKHKILLLLILTIAAGYFMIVHQKINFKNQVANHATKTFNCDNQNKTIAKISDDKEIDLSGKTCLYVGCSGFIY